jgi:hypothetical protein
MPRKRHGSDEHASESDDDGVLVDAALFALTEYAIVDDEGGHQWECGSWREETYHQWECVVHGERSGVISENVWVIMDGEKSGTIIDSENDEKST